MDGLLNRVELRTVELNRVLLSFIDSGPADNKVLQVVTDAEERGGQRVHTPEPVFQVIVRIKGK